MSNDKRCIMWSVAETKVEAAEWWEFKHTEVKKFRSLSETASVTQSPWAYVSSIFWIVAYSVNVKPLFLQSRRVKVAMWAVTLSHDFFFNPLLAHSRCSCSICVLKFGIAYKNKKSGENAQTMAHKLYDFMKKRNLFAWTWPYSYWNKTQPPLLLRYI